MTSRDQFEQAYSQHTLNPVEFIRLCRQGDSYSVPKVSAAWHWWQRSRATVSVEWPDQHIYSSPDAAGAAILDCRSALVDATQ